MSSIPAVDDVLEPDEPVYDLPTVAELLRMPVTRVHQQLRDGHLVAVRRKMEKLAVQELLDKVILEVVLAVLLILLAVQVEAVRVLLV